jgi:hypothetical protein
MKDAAVEVHKGATMGVSEGTSWSVAQTDQTALNSDFFKSTAVESLVASDLPDDILSRSAWTRR